MKYLKVYFFLHDLFSLNSTRNFVFIYLQENFNILLTARAAKWHSTSHACTQRVLIFYTQDKK